MKKPPLVKKMRGSRRVKQRERPAAGNATKYRVIPYRDERGIKLFDEWLATLRDKRAQEKLEKRALLMRKGDFGKTRAVGQGVIESQIEEGPGYRLYFAHYGPVVVLLICGGDKRTQDRDILFAQKCWAQWKKEKKHESER